MKGRRADPAAVKEAKGNPGKRTVTKEEVAAVEVVIGLKPPAELSAAAKKLWNKHAPDLQRLNFLQASDVPAFARYCETLALFWKACRALGRKSPVYKVVSPQGTYQRLNPWFAIMDRTNRTLIALEDRFGISPAARQTITYRLAQGAGAGAGAGSQQELLLPGENGAESDNPVGFLN